MKYKINHRPLFNTDKLANYYSEKDGVPIKYVCTSALGGEEFARDIFYRDTSHPEFGNRYFGIHERPHLIGTDGGIFISNADKIEGVDFDMIENPDTGMWEYSQHRHDFYQVGAVAIDGGRAYTRLVGNVNVEIKTFRIKNGEFVE